MNKTLADEWAEYVSACFPDEISGIQAQETNQAFFSGALSALHLMSNAATLLDENAAIVYVNGLMEEAKKVCEQHVERIRREES